MKKIWITSGLNIILAGCLVFLLFFYEGPKPSPSTSASEASSTSTDANAIVSKSCITCHGENLEGANGPNLTKIGSKYGKDEIENIINNGKNAMPSGVISKEDAATVAEWLSQKK
jgi:mono/diheme cytochrome c family protein